MTTRSRSASFLAVLIFVPACGGGPSSAEPPAPAIHELAALRARGDLDELRLACAAVTVVEVIPDLGYLWLPRRSPPRRGTNAHARAVQQSMAASDVLDAAAREAARAKQVASDARKAGDSLRAARADNWAADVMVRARTMSAAGAPVMPAYTGNATENQRLLYDYGVLWAVVMTGGTSSEEALELIGAIDEGAPEIAEAYATGLLQVYGQPNVDCGSGQGTP